MRDIILNELRKIEEKEDVDILFACRADIMNYDIEIPNVEHYIRFVYARPLKHYFSLSETKNEFKCRFSEGVEFEGIDLKSALKEFYDSNPRSIDCLRSNIIYIEPDATIRRLKELIDSQFSMNRVTRSYRVRAQAIFRGEIREKFGEWPALRVLLCLRYLFANRYIAIFKKFPPNGILEVMEDAGIDGKILQQVKTLLRHIKERGDDIPIVKMDGVAVWIERELKNTENLKFDNDNQMDVEYLNSIFFDHFRPEMRNLK